MIDENVLPPEIQTWVQEVGGGELLRADRRPAGGRREAWFVDLKVTDGSTAELFLRLDRSAAADSRDAYTTVREADVYRALEQSAIPVPRVLGVRDAPQAVLSERVTGETWFSLIRDPAEQLATARDFIRILAALHRIDPASLDIPSFPPLESARKHVQQELDAWQDAYATADASNPLIEFALDWLRRNVPAYEGPVVLVQGDTGPGNFLYTDGRVQAVLDWELAHWGDPMDDIAWLSVRAVQEPFTHFPDRLAEYVELSGHALDLARIRYHRVFAELRIVIMGHLRPQSSQGEVGNQIIYGALHHRLLVEALADVLGLPKKAPDLPDAPAPEQDWLYGAALDQIRDILVPRSTDAFVIRRAKGLARILKHLRDAARLAPLFAAQDEADLAELLSGSYASADDAREELTRRIRSHALPDAKVLRYFQRSTARRTELARSASGVMADRHFPPLE